MRYSLLALLLHAAAADLATVITAPANHTTTTLHTRRSDRPSCIKVTLADGTVWDRLCNPAHTCISINTPGEAPVRFEMPKTTVCTLFRGGKGDPVKWTTPCFGTPRDFEGGDRDLDPLPVWHSKNAKGWACYDRT